MSNFYVYIMASQRNGTLYVGLTDDIVWRTVEHKNKIYQGFTAKYSVNILVYFEEHETYEEAVTREKQLKKWKRIWKLNLIEKENPNWNDLSSGWFDTSPA